MGRIGIKDIPLSYDKEPILYEGYLWYSDQENPKVLDRQALTLPEGTNSFVVEGHLYNEAEGLSYSIKYVDGQYIIHQHKVARNDLDSPNEVKFYLSNRMDDKKLKFLRYWEERIAYVTGLGGIPVLTQTKNVFIGFKK